MVLATVVLACSRVVATLPSLTGKRPVVEVKEDIATIATYVDKLQAGIGSFPDQGGSLIQSLAIHADAVKVDIALKRGTANVERTGPVDEEDGVPLLESIRVIVSKTIHALETIVAKKPAFEALPFGAATCTIGADIRALYDSTVALGNALVAAAPASLKDEAMVVKAAIDEAFVKALAVYDSA